MGSAFAIELVLAIAVLAALGAGERGTDVALQATARFSFVLFWLAYTGGALASLASRPLIWLKRSARNFGLAFASALQVHLGLVAWLCWIGAAPSRATFLFFGTAAIFVYLLALFSIQRLQACLNPTLWRLIRAVGMNFIALAFLRDFLSAPRHMTFGYLVGYLPFVILAVAGPLLRGLAFLLNGRPLVQLRTALSFGVGQN
ncbi:hypothetical protein [Rhodopila globiformis]|uniref:Uncharacterized protein n=1 Tax=Rhodopila globiformis TaxID=1071 RepID=A0A2S6MW41_RHOGL|nr:hypothetical protein [Rhodopila globiformis]PPQ26583.1 hypothetical protein CCS01_29965 [Rhodopila globiformis]